MNEELKAKYPILKVGIFENSEECAEIPKDYKMAKVKDLRKGDVFHLTGEFYYHCAYPHQVKSVSKKKVVATCIHTEDELTLDLNTVIWMYPGDEVKTNTCPKGWKELRLDGELDPFKDFLYLPLDYKETKTKAQCYYYDCDYNMFYDSGDAGENVNVGYFKYVEEFTP